MKQGKLRRGVVLGVLVTLAVAVLTGPLASAFEFVINKETFKDPNIDTTMAYYWYKGLPENPEPGVHYNLLLTWDDQYWFQLDSGFSSELTGKNMTDTANDDRSAMDSDSSIANDTYPSGDYHVNRTYNQAAGSIAELPFNFQALKRDGVGVSLQCPEGVPFLSYAGSADAEDHYIMGVPRIEGSSAFGQENNWLTGELWYKVEDTGIFSAMKYLATLDWYLNARHNTEEEMLGSQGLERISHQGWATNPHGYTGTDSLDKRYWRVTNQGGNSYSFATHPGAAIDVFESPLDGRWNAFANNIHDPAYCRSIELTHKGSSLITFVSDTMDRYGSDRYQSSELNHTFDCYYGLAVPMNIIRTSFRVVDGQVVTLDELTAINQGTTVTVEDGGVLSVSKWVVNNGTIVVRPGGTLLVQDDAVVSTILDDQGLHGGAVLCDGLLLIQGGGKLVASGVDGLQLGYGAHCVNYGKIIAENMTVYTDHTVENRGSGTVYAGWGITDSGYTLTLWNGTSDYAGLGQREKAARVSLARDAVYGGTLKTHSRPGLVVHTDEANRAGQVTSGYATDAAPDSGAKPAFDPQTYDWGMTYSQWQEYYDPGKGVYVITGPDGNQYQFRYPPVSMTQEEWEAREQTELENTESGSE